MKQIVHASAEGILLEGQGDVWIEQSISKEIPLWQGYKKLMIAGGPSKLARVLSMGQKIVHASAEGILLEGQGDVWIEQSIVKRNFIVARIQKVDDCRWSI